MSNNKYHIVHTESSGGWGGQEIRILNEAKEFIQRGHKVTLVVSLDSPIAHRAREYNIPTVELPIGKKTFKGLFALRTWIANNDFDVINTHSSSDSWMVAIGMRLTLKRRPLVRTRHVSAPVSQNRATRWLYHKASDHIATTGEKLRETLIRDNGIPPQQITSVPTGIDCNIFTPADNKTQTRESLDLPQDKIIIGIVATLRSWKGHQYLIDAFNNIDNQNTHLLIVGHGPQWDNIHQQVSRLNIGHKVTLCGDQKEVTPWLQSMDVFTLPSYANEGVPQGIMQAMACGLPIISTTAGSITEIVTEETGLIVEKQSEDSLAQAINLLIEDENLRNTLGQQAMQFANAHCGIGAMTDKMDSIFSPLVRKNL